MKKYFVEDVKKIVQEKIRVSSKSVRDNTQTVTIKGDNITVVNNVGKKKLGSFDIDVKKWEELENSFGNPNYNKKQYIKELNKKAFPGNYSGEMENEPIISRVEDAQISAINEAYKKYKAESTAVKEQPKTVEDVKKIVEEKKNIEIKYSPCKYTKKIG